MSNTSPIIIIILIFQLLTAEVLPDLEKVYVLSDLEFLFHKVKYAQKDPHQTFSTLSILGQKVLLHQEPSLCIFETLTAVFI